MIRLSQIRAVLSGLLVLLLASPGNAMPSNFKNASINKGTGGNTRAPGRLGASPVLILSDMLDFHLSLGAPYLPGPVMSDIVTRPGHAMISAPKSLHASVVRPDAFQSKFSGGIQGGYGVAPPDSSVITVQHTLRRHASKEHPHKQWSPVVNHASVEWITTWSGPDVVAQVQKTLGDAPTDAVARMSPTEAYVFSFNVLQAMVDGEGGPESLSHRFLPGVLTAPVMTHITMDAPAGKVVHLERAGPLEPSPADESLDAKMEEFAATVVTGDWPDSMTVSELREADYLSPRASRKLAGVLDKIGTITHMSVAGSGLLKVLGSKRRLEPVLLEAMARRLSWEEAWILGKEPYLPESVRDILEEVMSEPARDEASMERGLRAARLLLVDNPENVLARSYLEVRSKSWFSRVPRQYRARVEDRSSLNWMTTLLGQDSLAVDLWGPDPRMHVDQVIASLGMGPLRQSFSLFLDFVARVRAYTSSARRLIKTLAKARYGFNDKELGEIIAALLEDPETRRERDFAMRDHVLDTLRETFPQALSGNESSGVVGILIRGSMSNHPSEDSDIDVVYVTDRGKADLYSFLSKNTDRTGYPNDVTAIDRVLDDALGGNRYDPKLDPLGIVPHNSLIFRRYLEMGALYLEYDPKTGTASWQ